MLPQPLDNPAIIHVGGNTSALFCQNGHNSASEGWTFFPLAKCLFCILRRGPNATRCKIKFACLGILKCDSWATISPPSFSGPSVRWLSNPRTSNCSTVKRLQRNSPNSANLWSSTTSKSCASLLWSLGKPANLMLLLHMSRSFCIQVREDDTNKWKAQSA